MLGRERRRAGAVSLILAATALLIGPPVSASGADRQTAKIEFTTERPSAATGSTLAIDFRNPDDPDGKPFAVSKIVIRYHEGTVYDTSVPDRCRASDAELIARGAAACPEGSRVGGGVIVTDNGSDAVFPRFIRNDVTTFNNEDELVNLVESKEPPTRVVGRAPIRGSTVTIEVPPVPGMPPPDPFNAFTRLRVSTEPISRGGRTYLRTPPKCPASGRWTSTVTFTYRDGVRQTETTTAPCTPLAGCRGRDATIVGGHGEDALRGTPRRDVIVARAGDDVVRGRGGNDIVCARRGDDLVRGGSGRDRVHGGAGDGNLRGGAGKDRVSAGTGRDSVRGGRGRDRLMGGADRDELRGGKGRDRCRGGGGRDLRRSCER